MTDEIDSTKEDIAADADPEAALYLASLGEDQDDEDDEE